MGRDEQHSPAARQDPRTQAASLGLQRHLRHQLMCPGCGNGTQGGRGASVALQYYGLCGVNQEPGARHGKNPVKLLMGLGDEDEDHPAPEQ